ncbi:hypothetical protein [Nonomuraea sp. B5E05]|uniref:hypothetical protein n=1 Tax=Nonomuraea sp. B5E05 TaxID=3153569 RepID=UPI0032605FE4
MERHQHRARTHLLLTGGDRGQARLLVAYAARVPVLGFSVPHLLWGLGVPFGVAGPSAAGLAARRCTGGLLVAGPVAGGLLALGLISRWGQIVPAWVPWLGGRRVPTGLAAVPALAVGLLVGQYGAMMTSCLAFGFTRTCAPEGGAEVLDGSWAFAGTYPVFLTWGVCLLGAAVGYIHTRRSQGVSPCCLLSDRPCSSAKALRHRPWQKPYKVPW